MDATAARDRGLAASRRDGDDTGIGGGHASTP